jgi:hypothetical protein
MPNPYLTLVESWKDLPVGVKWSEPDDYGKMDIFAPLEVGGVTVSGFALRGICSKLRIDRDVLFQLEIGIPGKRTRLPLARLEWRPHSPTHKNPATGGEPSCLIFGSHHHTHEANWLEQEGRMREGNLPFAESLNPDPSTYQDFLDLVRIRFRINGINNIMMPVWEPKLV